MRHFLLAGSVATLALGMAEAAPAATLVALSCGAERLTPGLLRAASTTVEVASVAVAAKHHLTPATGAVE